MVAIRRTRCSFYVVRVYCVEFIGDQRPQYPAFVINFHRAISYVGNNLVCSNWTDEADVCQPPSDNQTLKFRVCVTGLGPEISTEISFGVEIENRCVQLAFIGDEQGVIVGNKFGKQRQNKEGSENP